LNPEGQVDQAKVASTMADLRKKTLQQGQELAALKKTDDGPGLKLPENAGPQSVDELVSSIGHTHESLAQEWVDNSGSLSDDSYAKLLAQGYHRPLVDMFYQAQQAQANQMVQQATQAKSQAADMVGGEAQLDQLLHWARANLSQADQDNVNERLGDPNLVLGAVEQIQAAHRRAIGAGNAQPLITGDGQPGGGPEITTREEYYQLQMKAGAGDKAAQAAVQRSFESGQLAKILGRPKPMIAG
jgi:predicted NAD-dependent protein-ADP-ribosyltransferase YbiA (DUF1768 family)